MNAVQKQAIKAAEAHTKMLVDMLVDADHASEELRGKYTVGEIEKLARVYGGRL